MRKEAAALRTMARFLREHSRGCDRMVSYGFGMNNHAFDAFTNEPGLARRLVRLKRSSGAALGVSGALMEVAAFRRSTLLLSVDVNPSIGMVFLYFSAVLLCVDARARRQGWSASRRRLEVIRRLRGEDPEELLLRPLEALGVDRGIRDQVRQMVYPVRAGFEALEDGQLTWCTGPGAPARVLHMTGLAREARILSVTAELGTPAVVDLASRLSSSLELTFDHLHLSNALEYSPHLSDLCGTLRQVPLTDNACLSLSTQHFSKALSELRPATRRMVRSWGTFEKPSVVSARRFLAASAKIEDRLWSDPVCGRHWTEMALRTFHPPLTAKHLRTLASTRELDQLVQRLFHRSSTRVRRSWVREGLKRTGRWAIYRELIGDRRLSRLPLAVPAHPNEVIACGAQFDRKFWSSRGRKRMRLHKLLVDYGISSAVVRNLERALSICERSEDLSALSWDIRQRCEQEFRSWNLRMRRTCFEAVFDFYSKVRFRSIDASFRRRATPVLKRATSLEHILLGAHELRLEHLSFL